MNTLKSVWIGAALAGLLAVLPVRGIAETGLKPLSEGEMSAVTGREGIALDLKFGINMEPNASGDFVVSQGLGGCTGTFTDCRLALEFAGRADKWLVLKNFYGFIQQNNLQFDASTLSNTDSPHRDEDRFRGEGSPGPCLLAGCDPNGLPALQMSYGAQPVGQSDIEAFINIGRVSAEFGSTGYLNDAATGSVLGFRVSDQTQQAATADIDGQIYLFGF
jgi:hypothetical protein